MATSTIKAISQDVKSAFTASSSITIEDLTATRIGDFVAVSFRARASAQKTASAGWVQIASTTLRPSANRFYPAFIWTGSYSGAEVRINSAGNINVYATANKLENNNVVYVHMTYLIGK